MSELLPDGFLIYRGVIDRLVSHLSLDEMIASLQLTQPNAWLYGRNVEIPRLTAWYGTESYTYSGIRHEPQPMPLWMKRIKERVDNL